MADSSSSIDHVQVLNRVLKAAFEGRPWINEKYEEIGSLIYLAETNDQASAIIETIEKLHYIDFDSFVSECNSLVDHIYGTLKFPTGSTVFCVGISDDRVTGGDVVNFHLRERASKNFNVSKHCFKVRVPALYKVIKDFTHYVLVDDFIGSGTRFIRQLNHIAQRISNDGGSSDNILIAAPFGMTSGVNAISNIGFNVYCPNTLSKVFSDNYQSKILETKLAAIEAVEEKIVPKDHGCFCGFDRSETAFAIRNLSVPNNNFSFLWHPQDINKKPRKAPFHRTV